MVTKTFTGTVTECQKIVNTDDKEIYECTVVFPRKLVPELIDVGASVGVFAENMIEDVDQVISAFGWQADELLGNLTVKEMLLK